VAHPGQQRERRWCHHCERGGQDGVGVSAVAARRVRRHLDDLDLDTEEGRGEVTVDAYGFLTTEPNAVVVPVHPKAMPVILTPAEEIDV